jgi:hypothetical protein
VHRTHACLPLSPPPTTTTLARSLTARATHAHPQNKNPKNSQQEEQKGTIDGELATVLASISVACKQISNAVQRSGISALTGIAGTGENVQGEEQKKLDVISNDIFSMCLRNTGRTGIIASEEEEHPIAVEETTSGNYIVVFDPLDGSSNIDAGISVGSIFGIYEPSESCIIDEDPSKTLEMCITNVCQVGVGVCVWVFVCLCVRVCVVFIGGGGGVVCVCVWLALVFVCRLMRRRRRSVRGRRRQSGRRAVVVYPSLLD